MKKGILSTSPAKTKKIGEDLAKKILKSPLQKRAFVIGLFGGLGSGKTTFSQGLARGFKIKERVLSPTFVIMKKFKTQKGKYLFHIDCYRIQDSEEILSLGFKDIIADPKNIVVIEWADRIKKILLKDTLRIHFEYIDENTRKIRFSSSE